MASLQTRAAFLVSIDTEMAWGVVHRKEIAEHYSYRQERELIRRLLNLCEKYEIRATWSVVGHLFLDRCEPLNGRKHPEIVRPAYSWLEGDWFDADPCSDIEIDPIWYGKDIVEGIRQCGVPQEIGSHGFSHIIAGDAECSAESFDSELRACRQWAESADIALKSFVFPRNSVGHLDVLAKNGFITYRGSVPAASLNSRWSLNKLLRLLPLCWPSGSTAHPQLEGELWNLPATYFYSPSTYRWRVVPFRVDVRRIMRQLSQATRQKALVHIWFHPHNLTLDPDRSIKGLETIFKQVHKLREKGMLDNPTMGELAQSLQQVGSGRTNRT